MNRSPSMNRSPFPFIPLKQLVRAEGANLFRDPVYLFMILSPLLMGLFVRYGLPLLSSLLQRYTGFELEPYLPFIHFFFLQISPYMAGVMMGLLFLEERDLHLPDVWAVTPLGRSGYLLWKGGLTLVTALIMTLILLFFLPGALRPPGRAVLLLPLAFSAPISFFLLALFGEDKISGLALAKLSGVVLALPLLIFLPESFSLRWLIHLFAPVWMVRAWLAAGMGNVFLYCTIAVFLQMLPTGLFLTAFYRARVLPLRL